jgi:hypothetical protein
MSRTDMKMNVTIAAAFVASLTIAAVSTPSFGQEKMPIVRATSDLVDIRDGSEFKKGAWRISPGIKPDVYTTSLKNGRITFYTDRDSISFIVKPNGTYDFIILLNGKDSAVTQIRYEPGVLEVLKSGKEYDLRDTRVDPGFAYKSVNDSTLKSIRTRFKLDSIAGAGNEISGFLNMLHWVHTTFPHDGSKDAPQSTGVEDLMTKCIKDKRTLDCGSLATVLNECYSALGFKSRRIVCLPKDSTDPDCHSINTVYSRTLKKWLWMDPTNDAYVMDEHNELLGIAEVRERLIDERPLKLNPDANWNHINQIKIEDYLYKYMAKNLYALQWFYESNGVTKSVLLLPLEYEGIIPRTRRFNPACTHNPDVFWATPE